jgi:hypothetical protein
MTKIDPAVNLPGFHDRLPPRNDGNRFLQELQRTTPEASEGGPTEKAVELQRQQRVQSAEEERPAAELYGFGRLAQHRLSYLDDVNVAALQQHSGSLAGPASAPAAVTANLPHGTAQMNQVAPASTQPAITGTTTPAAATIQTPDQPEITGTAVVYRDDTMERLRRQLHFLATPGGVEAVLRDYESDALAATVEQVRAHCRAAGQPLVRIVVNGTVAWSARE